LSEQVTIAAAYEMKPGRYKDVITMTLFRQLLREAITEWGVHPQEIDGLLTHPCGYVSNPDNYVHDKLIAELGIRPVFAETMNIGGATYPAMVNRAAMAIQTGRASAVLCMGAGKFMKPAAGGGPMMAKAISDANLEVPYGTFIPALYGLAASQYMAQYGASETDLARVAVSARMWANLNPQARMHSEKLTVADVLASRMIATPFHYYDCSIPSDGGGAFLVTRADIGRRITPQPAYVVGYGEKHGRGCVSEPGDLLHTGAVESGAEAFRRAGMSPADIKVAQIYDAFSATPLMLLENLCFCGPGEAPALVASGATDPGGSLPMNTYGGLMSFGHTGDASGMSLVTAGALQAMGKAGPVQVAGADRVLIHAYGGICFDHTTLILSRET
jgi:acetyl-CoA acetyltransferase